MSDKAAALLLWRRSPRAPILVVLLLAALIRVPTLAFPLTETHPFRQTQTAFPAVVFASEGIDLLRPIVPVLGPPWVVPFEFPVVQAVAVLPIRLGLSAEVSLRGISLLAFLGSAYILWLILKTWVNQRASMIAALVFLSSPIAILFSRAALIEYPAVLGALLFVYGTLRWQESGSARWLLLALVAGVGTSLVKVTTALFWLAPALLLRRLAITIVVGASALAAFTWTVYADGIKATNPYTSFLTSARLVAWNFGGDRLDPSVWLAVLTPILFTAGLLLTPVACLVVLRREKQLWAWMGIALVGPPLLFTNLYAVHDYYAVALTPAIAALIGGGLDRAIGRIPAIREGATAVAVVVVVSTSSYWMGAFDGRDPEGILVRAEVIAGATQPEDLVVTIDKDWSPAAYFYAGRRGVVLQRSWVESQGLQGPAGGVFVP